MTHRIISTRTKWLLAAVFSMLSAFAQEQAANAFVFTPAVQARSILGLEGISKNALGDLAIENDALVFRIKEGPLTKIPIASIQEANLSQQDKQLGGIPMTLGRAAVPFEGGRVIGLFSHRKYDFVTVSYVDSNGGFRGAIWQLNKGQTEALAKELQSRGVHVSTQETKDETK